MHICLAFTAMLQDVRSADVSRRQVDGILDWLDLVRQAAGHARELNASPDCLQVTFSGAATHRTWRTSSRDILAALRRQEDEAARGRIRANLEAEEQERLAADKTLAAAAERMKAIAAHARAETARGQAAAARQEAAAARAQAAAAQAAAAAQNGREAPAAADNGAAFEAAAAAAAAQAAALDTQATAADGEAARAEANAARLEAEAEEHRRKAEELRRQAATKYLQWEMAARDARACGKKLIAVEDSVSARVYEGIQAAGGAREVPAQKRYATRDAIPALTGGGGR